MNSDYTHESKQGMRRLEANLSHKTFYRLRVLLTLFCREHHFPYDGITTVLAWIQLLSILSEEGSDEAHILNNEIHRAVSVISEVDLQARLNDMKAIHSPL